MIPINYTIAFKKSLTSRAVFLLRVSRLDTVDTAVQVKIGISDPLIQTSELTLSWPVLHFPF